jgi:crotonobetainyl-CoA:carnitine CoA-transferase CaiB-like acyl-CoA transferase
MTAAMRVRARLAASLRTGGVAVPATGEQVEPAEDLACPVLAWAASGAMWLTGRPDGPPQWPTGDVVGALRGTAALLVDLARAVGVDPGPIDIGTLLAGRAAARGGARQGAISVGGRSRILRTADGWLAVTLSRPDDLELLPALGVPLASEPRAAVEVLRDGSGMGFSGEDWDRLDAFTRVRRGGELMEAAQLLGLPAAEVTVPPGDDPPWSIIRIGGRRLLGYVGGTARRPSPGPLRRRGGEGRGRRPTRCRPTR